MRAQNATSPITGATFCVALPGSERKKVSELLSASKAKHAHSLSTEFSELNVLQRGSNEHQDSLAK